MPEYSRGDVWEFDWPANNGIVIAGPHPSLIVQTNLANHKEAYLDTIILPISSQGHPGNGPHVKIDPSKGNGLEHASFVKTEQIYTVMKKNLLRKLGMVQSQDMERIDGALKRVLALF